VLSKRSSGGRLSSAEPGKGLEGHEARLFTDHADLYRWTFAKPSGGVSNIAVSGPLASDEADLLVQAALAGFGVLNATDWYVGRDLADGRLVEVLSDYPIVDKGDVHVVIPASVGTPNKTGASPTGLHADLPVRRKRMAGSAYAERGKRRSTGSRFTAQRCIVGLSGLRKQERWISSSYVNRAGFCGGCWFGHAAVARSWLAA